ncbi:EamA family transporter [Neobacillus sp. NPDC097160]|uniref:EamA family transporter n=1 Tax=Neobacillus sp. NPDC097160 TaxID=3364298 RepID=UPI00380D1B10
MTIVNFSLILLNTLILVSGQFLWKYGLQATTPNFSSLISVLKLFLSPYIIFGLGLYGFATILWLFILTRVPLSVAYPIQSIAYVLSVFGAYFVFNEPLSVSKILGCIIIMAGVSLIGFSNS